MDRDKMIRIAAGERWPYRLAGAMQAIIDPVEEAGLTLSLVMAVSRPTSEERKAVRTAPLTLALLPTPDILWIVADLGRLSFDAPWCTGPLPLDARPAVAAGAATVQALPEATRGLVEIYAVDSADGIVFAARIVSCSRAWWRILAGGINSQIERWAGRSASTIEHRRIIDAGMASWPSTAALLKAATIVETAGKV
jgi:hypothetical protein